jgi:hypothetical protein
MKRYVLWIIAAGLTLPTLVSHAQTQQPPHLGLVMSGRVADMDKWFGRSGGLVGSDRVAGLRSGGRKPVDVTYDQSVEARTNMPVHPAGGQQHVLTTWDEGVARRTHMPLATLQHASPDNPFAPPRAVQ